VIAFGDEEGAASRRHADQPGGGGHADEAALEMATRAA
jgi:hypothetical protein